MKINYRDTTNSVERPAISSMTIWLSTEDEEWLSWLGLREYQMRFGSAQLKCDSGLHNSRWEVSPESVRRKNIVTRDILGTSWNTPSRS